MAENNGNTKYFSGFLIKVPPYKMLAFRISWYVIELGTCFLCFQDVFEI